MDPSYRWNEWDLRREALSLARQRGKGTRRTKAAQTALSAGSRNRGNQVCRQFSNMGQVTKAKRKLTIYRHDWIL